MGAAVSCLKGASSGSGLLSGGSLDAPLPRRRLVMALLRWIHFAHRRNRLLFLTAAHRNEVMAGRLAICHQKLCDQDATISRALQNVHASNGHRSSSEVMCLVCVSSVVDAVYCSSPERHAVCLSCVESWAEHAMQKPDRLPTSFACPNCCEECHGAIGAADLMRCNAGERVVREWHHRDALQHILPLASKDDDTRVRLGYLCHDGSYAARACPECGYGPIEHSRCDDLREFHNVAGYRNACPSCAYLVNDASSLARWDGTIRSRR